MLEIGTGSGYGAAVLSLLASEVHTIERHRGAVSTLHASDWHDSATKTCTCYLDDGTLGLPQEAPFDAIVVTAGAESLPEAYQEQLADGGRLISLSARSRSSK